MRYALTLTEDNRILSATYENYASDDAVLVEEFPEGDISNYLYVDGQYIYDPLPEPEQQEPAPTQLDRVESQIAYLAMMTGYTDILEV